MRIKIVYNFYRLWTKLGLIISPAPIKQESLTGKHLVETGRTADGTPVIASTFLHVSCRII